MRPLTARRPTAPRDPAPSKWKYRYQRWMLTPGVRGLVKVGLPLAVVTLGFVIWYVQDDNQKLVRAQIAQLKLQVQQRPEFMVSHTEITGAAPELAAQVAQAVDVDFPASSFDVDLEDVRQQVEAVEGVMSARLRLGQAGALVVEVEPRQVVAIWRDADKLRLLDGDGVFAGRIDARADRLDLPLIAGDGAQANIAQALALFKAAKPIAARVRGLVRMGERRWDLVLDRDQRILLPTVNPQAALDRVIVLHQAQDMLERDVAVVDMRSGARPTLRMNKEATDALRRVSQTEAEN